MNVIYLAVIATTPAVSLVGEFCRACAPKPVDHVAAVRKQSDAYAAALLKADEIALAGLLHFDYLGQRVPWGIRSETTDRVQAVVFWNRPHKVFMTAGKITDLKYTVEGVRVFGDTAIETGRMSCTAGGSHFYSDCRYVRVWRAAGNFWQVVHETYQ